jgi:hypothetical protein
MANESPSGPDSVIEHEGRLWKPKQGATSSAEEFLAAHALFIQLHRDSSWNPWVLDDRADELERAEQIIDEWTRAEPGHRPMTKKQLDAKLARMDREFEARQAADKERRARDRERYDPGREHARLSLLEHQSRLDYELHEISGMRDGTSFPAMDPRRRAEEVAKLEDSIARLSSGIKRLTEMVGDPEDVVDANGWLPRDRREIMLLHYRLNRQSEVKELRAKIPEGHVQTGGVREGHLVIYWLLKHQWHQLSCRHRWCRFPGLLSDRRRGFRCPCSGVARSIRRSARRARRRPGG